MTISCAIRDVYKRQTLEQVRGDVLGLQMPGLHLTRQALSSLGDIPLTAIIGGDLQGEAATAGGQQLGFAHGSLQLGVETRAITDDAQADVVVQQLLRLTTQRAEEQLHQRADFFGRALPVFTGEGLSLIHI